MGSGPARRGLRSARQRGKLHHNNLPVAKQRFPAAGANCIHPRPFRRDRVADYAVREGGSPLRQLLTAICVCLIPAAGATADDWPAWRGPAQNGVTRETALPDEWSQTKNVTWK